MVRVVKQPPGDKGQLGRTLSAAAAKKVAQNLVKMKAKGSGGTTVKGVADGSLVFTGAGAAAPAAGEKPSTAAPAAAGSSTIRDGEYSDPDNMEWRYRVLGGKYYILGRPGAPAGTRNPVLVTDPKQIAAIQGVIGKLNQSAVPSNLLTALAASAAAAASGIAMPAQSALLNFVGMRQQLYSFTSPSYRQKMWYVVQRARKRLGGKPGLIDYTDYKEAQRLDPEYKNNVGDTWGQGAEGPSALISTNPYCQLSVTFGHCNFKAEGDEFLVYDRYEFILDRDPSYVEAAGDYLFGLPFIKKSFESFKKGGFAAVADFEGLLVSYENTFNYRGYPTAIKTLKPDVGTLELLKAYASQFVPGAIDTYYNG
jgi:hypothetical protein